MTTTIPESDRIAARPVWKRHLLRQSGFDLWPPSEEEIADAIKVLREAPAWEKIDRTFQKFGGATSTFQTMTRALILEAERIHEDASRAL